MKMKNHFKKNISLITGILLLVCAVSFNPAPLLAAKKKMTKGNKEFLSKVRYIISKDEKKFFKNLPEERKAEFIRQFWEVRDPNPDTTENEFREEYNRRIDEANRQFTAGLEGWLTDRGKTYILLGPPRHTSEHPLGGMGTGSYRFRWPYVVWHYYDIVVIFVDRLGDGDYRVEYIDMHHHGLVQEAFIRARRELSYIEDLFNYNFVYKKIKKAPHLIFTFDLEEITFKPEGDKMVSRLEIFVNVKDLQYNDVWNYQKTHAIAFSKSGDLPGKAAVKIPIEKLEKGKYFFFTSVRKMDEREKAFNNKLLKVK